MSVSLSLGCKAYPWIRPLVDGSVDPDGIDLRVEDGHISPVYYSGVLDDDAFDVAELSLGAYLASLDHAQDNGVTAIPVFPNRCFRQSFLYVERGSGYDDPSDLNSGAIGMINWQFTGGVWLRGILAERHGLDLQTVEWHASRPEYVPVDRPDEYDISTIQRDAPGDGESTFPILEQMLAEGTLDAVITPTELRSDRVERLFADPFERERQYYQETGLFPIHHVMVIRDEVVATHPGVPEQLYEAFEAALERSTAAVDEPGWFKVSPLVWSLRALEEQRAVFDRNPWTYGLDANNRRNLRKAIEYASDQGVISGEPAVADLFIDGIDGTN
jgi:4,5-dihydroxyphthalate decarboxylase